jgi:murein DD-endopeptidase MepM/ murein hydrolase activator NlpD
MPSGNNFRTFLSATITTLVGGVILFTATAASAMAHTQSVPTSEPPTVATFFPLVETPPLLRTTPIDNSLPENLILLPPGYATPLQLRPEDHYYFARPLPSTYKNQLNDDYRYGTDYSGEMKTHTGVDVPAARWVPVLAAADGVVVWSGVGLFGHYVNKDDPYGMAVSIRHDFGYFGKSIYTAYAHMDELEVVVGQRVKQGQMIGKVGDTGKADGTHLHFEVREGEDSFFMTRNPQLWLVPPEGYGVLAGRIESIDFTPLVKYPFIVRREGTNQMWSFQTYIPDLAHSDDTYQENFVLSDLPAGKYQIDIWVWWQHYLYDVEIVPGMTTFILVHAGNSPLVNPPMATPTFNVQ